MAITLMEGNDAIAHGAVAAGCRFFAGYPITPATTIYNAMINLLPPIGGICLQGEDEIASIGFCLGAAMAGMKVMTATSGPGLSLFSENISFAIGSEIPIVIVDVQRLGPSTGSATRGADDDIQFLRWGNSGGLPAIVLAPVDIKDCYELTMHAFNLAETFRCPVFIASNKEIALTRETLDIDTLATPSTVSRKIALEDKPYLPFATDPTSLVPAFLPLGAKQFVRQTSSTYGPDGYITIDPDQIAANQNRLNHKLDNIKKKKIFCEIFHFPSATTLIITYGITARAVKAALLEGDEDHRTSILILKTLWPVPETLIQTQAATVKRIVVVEMNLGQYVHEIRRILPGKRIDFYGQMNGELIRPNQIIEVIKHG
ncbi:MAG: pyruvate flavodoxin/ferredoxin oxidoreductase [Desulfobacteraceae bacterium]